MATPDTEEQSKRPKANIAFERDEWGKLWPFWLLIRGKSHSLSGPVLSFHLKLVWGLLSGYWSLQNPCGFYSFKSISLGNLAKHFMGKWPAPRIFSASKFTYVHHCKKHARSRETFNLGNGMLIILCTPQSPSFHPRLLPSFFFSRHASIFQENRFLFSWAKKAVEKSPLLKRKQIPFFSSLPRPPNPLMQPIPLETVTTDFLCLGQEAREAASAAMETSCLTYAWYQ